MASTINLGFRTIESKDMLKYTYSGLHQSAQLDTAEKVCDMS